MSHFLIFPMPFQMPVEFGLKFMTIIGSYGWGGKMVETIQAMIGNLKVEILPPVIVKGCPKGDDFKALDRLADDILSRHKAINIIPSRR